MALRAGALLLTLLTGTALSAHSANSKRFLGGRDSPATRASLKTRKSFKSFLRRRKVPRRIAKGFLVLYEVLEASISPNAGELAHILPTAVQFLADGNSVVLDKKSNHYYGMTRRESPAPEKVSLSGKTAALGPWLVAKTLVHEFQHVYDHQIQRTWPPQLMEARAEKAAALWLAVVKKSKPQRYAKLKHGKSFEARDLLRAAELCLTALEESSSAFVRAAGFDQCRGKLPEPMAAARYSLKEKLDSIIGYPAELQAIVTARDRERLAVADLNRRRELVRTLLRAGWDAAMTAKLETLDRDLGKARLRLKDFEMKAAFMGEVIERVSAEYAWLKAKDGPDAVYDLHLAVDPSYFDPS